MNISDELLDKYFKGQCSPEEKLRVINYLNETDHLPEHLLSKDEWDQTKDARITDDKTEEMFNVVRQQTIARTYRLRWKKIIAVAAIVITLLTIGFLNLNRNLPVQDLAQNKTLNPKKINPVIHWKSVVNYTEQNQLLTLPDGSVVKIYPRGEVRYTLPFIKTNREVYLKGKSFFEVAKDKKHPFVVHAKGIATTALGTSFTITASEKSKLIKVQLHTGKVWIKNEDSLHHIVPFSKILMPGNELVYNSSINKVTVVTDAKPVMNKRERNTTELSFTQAPLVEVLTKLQQAYKVKIEYNPLDLQEISFTGSLKLTQPINTILEEITELNKLNYIKTTEGYLISQ